MQILIFILIVLVAVAFIVYKIRHKFSDNELYIVFGIFLAVAVGIFFYLQLKENKIPNLFTQKYEAKYNTTIEKLSSTMVNNKYVSSDKNFVYDFDYIIRKDGKEFYCKLENVKIVKIEDEYIFENFEELNQECKNK